MFKAAQYMSVKVSKGGNVLIYKYQAYDMLNKKQA